MDVTLNQLEIHDFAGIIGTLARVNTELLPGKFAPEETAYLSTVSLLGGLFSEKNLYAACRCLYSLVFFHEFLSLDGRKFSLPPLDAPGADDPLICSGIYAFFAAYSYYLYENGKVTAPEEAIRPLSFVLYEAAEGVNEGIALTNEAYLELYQTKKAEGQPSAETLRSWSAHLNYMKAEFEPAQ